MILNNKYLLYNLIFYLFYIDFGIVYNIVEYFYFFYVRFNLELYNIG